MSLIYNFLSSNIFNYLILGIIVIEKILNFFWVSKYRKNYITNSNQKLGNLHYIRTYFYYTSTGTLFFTYLLIDDIINPILFENILMWNCLWSILFSITMGFYIYVYPYLIFSSNFNALNKLLNYWCHGPYLVLATLKLGCLENPFSFNLSSELYYCLLISYFWLFFIWLPWNLFTGDYLYEPLDNKLSLKRRLINIAKFKLLLILGIFLKYFLMSIFYLEYNSNWDQPRYSLFF